MYRKKHGIYRVRYYPWSQASTGDLATYFPWIMGDLVLQLQEAGSNELTS